MFCDAINPITLPRNTVILRPHWNYVVKRSWVRLSRQCCNGSKFAAPLLHVIVSTWSSCVELPIQGMCIGLCAQKGLCIYDGDTPDVYAHTPSPKVMTHLTIDDAYFEWYKEKTNGLYSLSSIHYKDVQNLGKCEWNWLIRSSLKIWDSQKLPKIIVSTSKRSKDVPSC